MRKPLTGATPIARRVGGTQATAAAIKMADVAKSRDRVSHSERRSLDIGMSGIGPHKCAANHLAVQKTRRKLSLSPTGATMSRVSTLTCRSGRTWSLGLGLLLVCAGGLPALATVRPQQASAARGSAGDLPAPLECLHQPERFESAYSPAPPRFFAIRF
jgi:hypothetical protein